MKKIMLLLTRKYPYSFGEPFLENELPKHVPYYDKILVLSQDVSKGEEATRVLPGGVEAVITATSSRNKLRRQDVFRLLPSFLLGNERIRKERQSRKVNVVQKMFLCYLDARCQRLIREAQGATSNIDFKQYEQITIYSYWFFANAVVAVALKKYLREKLNFRGRIVLISRAHRYDIYEEANSIKYLPFRKFLLDEIDYVFPCSQDGTEYLHRKYFKTKAKIETAYLGTKDYGLSSASQSGVFHLVSCSRVVKVKGLERLIDALAQLKIDQYK
ncbi:glycosyltransferase involved in cell wall biosynthesis [Lachnospiraceae bacterium PH1-22]